MRGFFSLTKQQLTASLSTSIELNHAVLQLEKFLNQTNSDKQSGCHIYALLQCISSIVTSIRSIQALKDFYVICHHERLELFLQSYQTDHKTLYATRIAGTFLHACRNLFVQHACQNLFESFKVSKEDLDDYQVLLTSLEVCIASEDPNRVTLELFFQCITEMQEPSFLNDWLLFISHDYQNIPLPLLWRDLNLFFPDDPFNVLHHLRYFLISATVYQLVHPEQPIQIEMDRYVVAIVTQCLKRAISTTHLMQIESFINGLGFNFLRRARARFGPQLPRSCDDNTWKQIQSALQARRAALTHYVSG